MLVLVLLPIFPKIFKFVSVNFVWKIMIVYNCKNNALFYLCKCDTINSRQMAELISPMIFIVRYLEFTIYFPSVFKINNVFLSTIFTLMNNRSQKIVLLSIWNFSTFDQGLLLSFFSILPQLLVIGIPVQLC